MADEAPSGVERPVVEARIPWKPYLPLVIVAILLAIAFTAYQFMSRMDLLRPLPVYYQEPVPAFTGVDQEGQPFSIEKLRGKVWVADFIFTRCSGTCPVMAQRMYEIQQKLLEELSRDHLSRVRLVSFTVDQEHDTVPKLKAYARMSQAMEGFWSYVTAEPGEVQELAVKGFKLATAKAGEETEAAEAFIHSSKLTLVDSRGYIRGYFEGVSDLSDPEAAEKVVAEIVHRVRQLLGEA